MRARRWAIWPRRKKRSAAPRNCSRTALPRRRMWRPPKPPTLRRWRNGTAPRQLWLITAAATRAATKCICCVQPLAGVLVEKNINPGQELRADQMLANAPNLFAPLFVVSDPDTALAATGRFGIRPAFASGRDSNSAFISQAFPGKVFDGTVDNIGDSTGPGHAHDQSPRRGQQSGQTAQGGNVCHG